MLLALPALASTSPEPACPSVFPLTRTRRIAFLAAVGLIVPIPSPPVSLPTTTSIAVGVLESTKTIKGDLYAGGTDTLDLSSMLEGVPSDLKGAEGVQKDQAGKERMLSSANEKKLTPAEQQAAKKAAFAAKQAADAEKPLFPSFDMPKL